MIIRYDTETVIVGQQWNIMASLTLFRGTL